MGRTCSVQPTQNNHIWCFYVDLRSRNGFFLKKPRKGRVTQFHSASRASLSDLKFKLLLADLGPKDADVFEYNHSINYIKLHTLAKRAAVTQSIFFFFLTLTFQVNFFFSLNNHSSTHILFLEPNSKSTKLTERFHSSK